MAGWRGGRDGRGKRTAMDRRTWLRGEIGAWRAEGLVDAATAALAVQGAG